MTASTTFVSQDGLEAASEWALRLAQEAPLDDGEALALAAWLDADPARHLLLARRREILADPALAQAIEQAGQRADRGRPGWWSGWHWAGAGGGLAAAAAALIVAGTLLLAPQDQDQDLATPPSQSVYATALAETRLVTLEDGAVIHMNADTRVSVAYSTGMRRVALIQGEASFDVPADPGRPFHVNAPGLEVRVVGTRFNVNTTRVAARIDVQQGAVEISGGGHQARLSAGEAVLMSRDTQGWTLTAMPASDVDWREGWLELEGASLSFLLENLNRYSDRPYRAVPEAGQLPVTGRFRIDAPGETVDLLSQFFGLNVNAQGDQYTVTVTP